MSKYERSDILTVPNVITSFRIAGTASLLFIRPTTRIFYILYFLCGFSDVLDGFIARRTGKTSALGARLDSIADLLLYAVMILKVMPRLIRLLPVWIWTAVAVIVVLRLASYIVCAVRFRCFSSMHTYMNKVTGAAVFCLPFALLLPDSVGLCICVCIIAALSSVEELLIHICSGQYDGRTKSIFGLKK